ncbi:MAG: TolC family protein [Candidatus Riflebacteria bacterium]|nr:TolC family protein [Candidatus Riflebacteria bacterium]
MKYQSNKLTKPYFKWHKIKLLFAIFLLFTMARVEAANLSSIIQMAASESLELKIEKIRIDEERFEEVRAHNAMIPKLNGLVSHSRETYLDSSLFSIFGSQYYSTLVSMELVQAYPGLGKIPRIQEQMAALKTFYKKVEFSKAENLLKKEVVRLFFELALQAELIKVDQENLGLLKKLKEVAEIKKSVGLALSNDVLRIEVEIANYESGIESRSFAMQNLRVDLANILNASNSETLPIELPKSLEFATVTLDLNGLEAAMIQSDFEIELARQDCKLVDKYLSGEQAARLPTFSLDGKYNLTNAAFGYKNVRDYSMNFALSFPIYDSGDIKNQFSKQKKTLDRLHLALENRIKSKKAMLKKAWTDYEEMGTKLQYGRKSVEQSRENMRVMMARYEAGEASIIEMIDAQLILSKSLQNLASFHRDERIRLAQLYFLSLDSNGYENLDQGAKQ